MPSGGPEDKDCGILCPSLSLHIHGPEVGMVAGAAGPAQCWDEIAAEAALGRYSRIARAVEVVIVACYGTSLDVAVLRVRAEVVGH